MSKKITINNLGSAIEDALSEYGDEVTADVKAVTKSMAQVGVRALKSESKSSFGGTGRYAKGWTYATRTERLSAGTTIYNKLPGLPHLLENGHAKRNGGRVDGTVHIAPVEKELAEKFEKEILSKL